MRFKVHTLTIFGSPTLTIFGSNKLILNKPWHCNRMFNSEYMDPEDPNFGAYSAAISEMFRKNDQEHVMFADSIIKVNRKFQPQVQVIVVTLDFIFKYKPKSGKFKIIKVPLPIKYMSGVYMSKNTPDKWCVVKFDHPYRDMVLNLGSNQAERLSEFVTVLSDLKGHPENFVHFVDTIKFNNSRSQKSDGFEVDLSFVEGDANYKAKYPGECIFKGNKRGSTITYPPKR